MRETWYKREGEYDRENVRKRDLKREGNKREVK